MDRVIVQFPDEKEYLKFHEYVKLNDCISIHDKWQIICKSEAVEVKIAEKIFNAKVITD